jgi:predicted DNA-binding transcriptional regulator AlpA
METSITFKPAGMRPRQFWAAVGISRAAGYALPADLQPKSIKLGHARIITEAPSEYLERLAQRQREAA